VAMIGSRDFSQQCCLVFVENLSQKFLFLRIQNQVHNRPPNDEILHGRYHQSIFPVGFYVQLDRSPPHFRSLLLAFLMREEAFLESSSVSNPNTAEYFLPITCATRKVKLIPASASDRAIA